MGPRSFGSRPPVGLVIVSIVIAATGADAPGIFARQRSERGPG